MSKNKEESNEGKTFSVSVAEEIKMAEQHPGGEKPEPTREEVLQQILERKVLLSARYVPAHKIKARWVTEEDIPRLIEEANVMAEMCLVGRGAYNMASGLAHTQICDEDPLRFFVRLQEDTGRSEILINPVIINTGGDIVMQDEGCLTFPEEPLKMIGRFEKITVEYQTLAQKRNKETNEPIGELFLTERTKQYLHGHIARIFQHEVSHLNGKYIYDEDRSALDCMGCHDLPPKKEVNIDKAL